MDLKLNTMKIHELGEHISKFLDENGLSKENSLVISVSKNELRKIDEELYYRNKPDGKDFTPSDEDVIVKFKNLNIIFAVENSHDEK